LNSGPRPYQGRALPTELLQRDILRALYSQEYKKNPNKNVIPADFSLSL